MKIKVTQDHIDNGIVRDDNWCPIALAIREQCPKGPDGRPWEEFEDTYDGFEVNGAQVEFGSKTFYLPSEAQLFIRQFDNEESVNPFEFELEGFEC